MSRRGQDTRIWTNTAYCVLVSFICVLVACQMRAEFDIEEFTRSRSDVIKAETLDTAYEDKRFEFSKCLSDWVGLGLAERFWTRIYTDYDVVKILFTFEIGNPNEPLYSCKTIARTTEGYMIASSGMIEPGIPFEPSIRRATEREIEGLAREIENRFVLSSVDSDLSPEVEDPDLAILISDLGASRKGMLFYSTTWPSTDSLRELIEFVESM